MAYVDGFVVPVPTANRDAYQRLAEQMSVIFKDFGALQVVECWGEDVPEGELTSFPMAVKREPDETVVFSWIIWPSKAARDDGNKKAFEDPRMEALLEETTAAFDSKRMIFGGFDVLAEA